MPRDANGLTPKQARFVHEYLIDLNATQAAIRSGYSKHTANEIGAENLAKPSIRAAVEAGRAKAAAKAGITLEDHLKELARIRDAAILGEDYKAAGMCEVARGKHSGVANPDKHEVTGAAGGPLQVWTFGKSKVAF
jgi:phage terminase small subunit